jgi:Fic family protein
MERVGDIELLFKLRKASRISSIQSSVAIEANSLTLEQVTDIINGRKVKGDQREIQEVQNAWDAYEGIGNYAPYSLDDFLLAHSRVSNKLVREPGRFRSMQVGVYKGFELIHDGAAPDEIESLMQQVFEWGIKSNAHPLIKSCVLHFLIEFVHPFEDGNGRMGRLWQTVILADWNKSFAWVPVETLVYQNQFGYYQALRESEQSNDAAVFVSFMLQIIEFTLTEIVRSKQVPSAKMGETVTVPYLPDFSDIPDINDNMTDKIVKITDKLRNIPDNENNSSHRYGLLVDLIPDYFIVQLSKTEIEFLYSIFGYLCEHGQINNYRAQTLSDKSADSVKKYFAKLVRIGFLEAVGKNKARVYRFADFSKGAFDGQ